MVKIPALFLNNKLKDLTKRNLQVISACNGMHQAILDQPFSFWI